MATNQFRIDPWQLGYANADGVLALNVNVPGMQVSVDYTLDCGAANVNLSKVRLLNASALEWSTNGTQCRYPVKVTGPLVSGSLYVTNAQICLSNLTTAVEMQVGIYWAECDDPQNMRGVPRFAFQGRTVVQFNAVTNYFAQKWNGEGWDAAQTQVSSTPTQQVDLRSGWSDLAQMGAHANCTNCTQMPIGAPHGAWQFYGTTLYPIYPPPSPTPPSAPGPSTPPAHAVA